jgi:3-oxoisoapionate decarboxylase
LCSTRHGSARSVVSVDGGAALAEPGVKVVIPIEEGVAVVAETVPDAHRGLQALQIELPSNPATTARSPDSTSLRCSPNNSSEPLGALVIPLGVWVGTESWPARRSSAGYCEGSAPPPWGWTDEGIRARYTAAWLKRWVAVRLGLDTYSLRWQGWNAFEFLDHAARLGLDNVQFSERSTLESLERAYLLELKSYAGRLGLSVEIGMLSLDQYSSFFRAEYGSGEQQLTDLLHAASVVGSPIVRCLLGGQAERVGSLPFQQHVEEVLRVLRDVAAVARDLNVKVAVENHGGVDFLARELRSLVEAAGSDYVGVCLDTGNPAYGGEDPVLATEILAPYIVATQVRDTRVWRVADGAMAQWVPLGQGNVDMLRIRDVFSEQAPSVAFNIEIITGEEPVLIPYLKPEAEFWRAYPEMLARDFARFVALAETGRAEQLEQATLPAGIAPPAGAAGEHLRQQQREHFEQSVTYARDVLKIGEREWRRA